MSVLRQEMLRDRQDVIDAVAQRRQAHVDNVEAVVEILAKGALLHHFLEVLVGGRHYPHVDALHTARAHRANLLFL